MSNIIRTLSDIHPDQIYVTSKQYKVIKGKKSNKPFKIKNVEIAQQLIILSLVKKEEKRKHREYKTNDEEWEPLFEETGKYLLTPEGEYYIDYRMKQQKSHFWNEFRAWITLIIAIAGFALSVYSIYLSHFAGIK